jgi:iron-sulfur cluster repair protein YtfE (RIC family)
VTGYLQADHRRLDGLIEACRATLAAGDSGAAAGLFGEFRAGLLRHIKIEEEMVFPEFEAATGLDPTHGPTGVMRYEHEEITRMLELIRELLSAPEPGVPEFERLRDRLTSLLHEHNAKEERILYPMTDRMVQAERLRGLVERMRSFA